MSACSSLSHILPPSVQSLSLLPYQLQICNIQTSQRQLLSPFSFWLLSSYSSDVLFSGTEVATVSTKNTPTAALKHTRGSLTSTLRRSGKIRKTTVEETPGGGRRRREETDRGWVCGRGGNQTWCFTDRRRRYWGTECVCGQPGCVCVVPCVCDGPNGGGGLCCQRQLKLHRRLTAANIPTRTETHIWDRWRRACYGDSGGRLHRVGAGAVSVRGQTRVERRLVHRYSEDGLDHVSAQRLVHRRPRDLEDRKYLIKLIIIMFSKCRF